MHSEYAGQYIPVYGKEIWERLKERGWIREIDEEKACIVAGDEMFKEGLGVVFRIELPEIIKLLQNIPRENDVLKNAYYEIGNVFFEQNKFKEAFDSYNTALLKYPD